MTALVRVPFHGDEIECVQRDDGVWISLRRACESLGLDVDSQRAKLKSKAWATCTVMSTVQVGDDQAREVFCLHLDSVPMWLATIEPSRVAEGVREKLVAYQREAARVLRDHFFGRTAASPPVDIAAIVAAVAPAVVAALVPAMGQMLQIVRAEAELLRQEGQTIGPSGHNRVRLTLTNAARAISGERSGKAYKSARGTLDTNLRNGLGWNGTGRTWAGFPLARQPDLAAKLEEIRRLGEATRRDPQTEFSLTIVDGKKKPDAAE